MTLCPRCGSHAEVHKYDSGAKMEECMACDWWDFVPAPPTTTEINERHREQWDGFAGVTGDG